MDPASGPLQGILGCVRDRHELIRFTPDRENYHIHDGSPPQGLSEARRAMGWFLSRVFSLPNRHGGAPSGVAALIILDRLMGNNPRITPIHVHEGNHEGILFSLTGRLQGSTIWFSDMTPRVI